MTTQDYKRAAQTLQQFNTDMAMERARAIVRLRRYDPLSKALAGATIAVCEFTQTLEAFNELQTTRKG